MTPGSSPVTDSPPLTGQLGFEQLVWLVEHPAEAKQALKDHAAATAERTGALAEVEKIKAEGWEIKSKAESDAAALRQAAERETADGVAAIKARRLEAEGVVAKMIADATAEAKRLTDLAAEGKATVDAENASMARARTLLASQQTAMADASKAMDKRAADLDRRETAIATKEADLKRRLGLLAAAAA